MEEVNLRARTRKPVNPLLWVWIRPREQQYWAAQKEEIGHLFHHACTDFFRAVWGKYEPDYIEDRFTTAQLFKEALRHVVFYREKYNGFYEFDVGNASGFRIQLRKPAYAVQDDWDRCSLDIKTMWVERAEADLIPLDPLESMDDWIAVGRQLAGDIYFDARGMGRFVKVESPEESPDYAAAVWYDRNDVVMEDVRDASTSTEQVSQQVSSTQTVIEACCVVCGLSHSVAQCARKRCGNCGSKGHELMDCDRPFPRSRSGCGRGRLITAASSREPLEKISGIPVDHKSSSAQTDLGFGSSVDSPLPLVGFQDFQISGAICGLCYSPRCKICFVEISGKRVKSPACQVTRCLLAGET
jgi:hypothetical protein